MSLSYGSALKSSRLLEDMAARGIKYVDCYGVDNALVSSCYPLFSSFLLICVSYLTETCIYW